MRRQPTVFSNSMQGMRPHIHPGMRSALWDRSGAVFFNIARKIRMTLLPVVDDSKCLEPYMTPRHAACSRFYFSEPDLK